MACLNDFYLTGEFINLELKNKKTKKEAVEPWVVKTQRISVL